ncbi:unnamed protein product [Cuscuta epithymum]|uniref:catechol oxidase n=1 Tax=Cuscuta epithymum TaxID=186058 RepID=A0AAV0DC65_9ASTE|nr:unnamed protein product [Cuscuta epithymum]
MKELPEDDPRNFYQQANVHCAYCNGAYKLAGGQEYQVHFSWLFFPFHRWYLYFHERILQSLIGDPTFTLPYWNWDNPQGMFLPEIFDDKASPLYNEVRDQRHHKDLIVDLAYSAGEALNTTELQILRNNLAIMYRQMVTNAPCPALFFGNTLRGEGYDTKSGGGTIENVPHNTLHRWVGDPTMTNNEDMGNFYSAAKDPVFYCHHGNVDRMWSVWKGLGGKRRDIADPDWLQSEFLFYDENKNLVKVNVQDCLDHKKLGYTFQDMPTQWMRSRPTSKKKTQSARSTKISIPLAINILPTTLQQTVTFYVMRPKTSRSKQEKADTEELLNLSLTYDETKYIRFDVFLNEDNLLKVFELDRAEYLGSFANLAHIHENSNENQPKTTTYSLAITELLEDLGLELDKNVAVTVVPKYNGEFMTINSVDVSLLSC